MCCFVLILGFLGPRIAFLAVWIFGDDRVQQAFSNNFWWPLLGVIFLPWTALAYVAAWAPTGGVTGIGWVVVILGFLLDIASYAGRSASRRSSAAA